MILYSLLAGENMIFVDLGNKNKTFCKKIINLLRKSDRKIIINSKYFEITKDNIKIINVENEYELINLLDSVESNKDITVINKTNNQTITAKLKLSPREKTMIQYGGLLNAIKELGGDF